MCDCGCVPPECDSEYTKGREQGFHEGKQFAIDVITKAILAHEDTPIIALDAARKALQSK